MLPIEHVQVLRPQQFKYDLTYQLIKKLLESDEVNVAETLCQDYLELALDYRIFPGSDVTLRQFLFDPLEGYFAQNLLVQSVCFIDGKFHSQSSSMIGSSELERIAQQHNSLPLVLIRPSKEALAPRAYTIQ